MKGNLIIQRQRVLLLILLMCVCLISTGPRVGANEFVSRIDVSMQMFSGRPDPYFIIDDENDIKTIYEKIQDLPESEKGAHCWGLLLEFHSGDKIVKYVHLCKGVIEFEKKEFKDERGLEEFLKIRAKEKEWKGLFSKEEANEMKKKFLEKKN